MPSASLQDDRKIPALLFSPLVIRWFACRCSLHCTRFCFSLICNLWLKSRCLKVGEVLRCDEAPTRVRITVKEWWCSWAKEILDIITILPQFNRTLDSAETYTKSFHHFYVALWNLLGGTQLFAWIHQSFFYLPFDLQRPICIRNRPTNCPEHGLQSFRVLKLTASSWVVARHLLYDKVSSNLEQVARNS